MIEPSEIRTHLIDRLAAIFGKPKNAEALAGALAKQAPANAVPDALAGLADRIIETRKTKGFPAASELIAAIKAMPVAAAAGPKDTDDGTIRFDGPAPVTWVPADDPRWGELVAMALKANPKARIGPTTSKYAPGMGWYFPSNHVDALPLTDAERDTIRATRDPQRVVERVASNMKALGRQLRASAEPVAAVPARPGEGRYAQALREQAPELQTAVGE